MGNAIWLFFATPLWFFETLFFPLSAGPLTAIPAFGALLLVVGTFLAFRARQRAALLYLIPFALSQCIAVIAGFFRGQLSPSDETPLWLFLAIQSICIGWLLFRIRAPRLPGVALATFSAIYAIFAMFVASMSFSDNWM